MASNGNNQSGPIDVSTTSNNVEVDIAQQPGDRFAGYIFMCNTKTKPDCFTYRVFGLPASMIAVVEKIKPNTPLFLYDFEIKLLYGLYVADSVGMLALEPSAFQGRFPAQVKFSIMKDCFPLPVAAFKDAIGYTGSKFKQDLSHEQVNKLVSLFRPVPVPTTNLQAPLSIHSIERGLHHDVLHHPSYRHAEEVPRLSLHSSYSQIALRRGGEFASDPYLPFISKRYLSAYSNLEDSDIQHHNRVRYGLLPTVSPLQSLPNLPLTPSKAKRSSPLTAAQWVALAAETENLGDDSSTVNQSSSSQPGTVHGKKIDDVPGYTDASYGKWRYPGPPGTHEAVSVPTEQLVPRNAQSQGDPVLPHPTRSESGGVTAAEVYPYQHTTSATSVSYAQGSQPYSGYHQTPAASLHQEVNNTHEYQTPSAYSQVAIPEGSQLNGYHQIPTVSAHQDINNTHAYETLSGYSQVAIPDGTQPYTGYPHTAAVIAPQDVSNANVYGTPSGYSQVAIQGGSQPHSGYYQTHAVSGLQDVNNAHAYGMPSGYSQAGYPTYGYGYENQGYGVYYQAPLVTGDQSVTNNFPAHAYENHAASTSNIYVQSQGVPYITQTQPPESGVVVDNAYSYYQQGYYYPHQMAPVPSQQVASNVPAQVPEAQPT